MQRNLAREIRQRGNGVYNVTREEEVADKKHPDIRLSVANRDLKAAIELKIADNWTLANLEQALWSQLAGQYLRHSNCTAGCLLLTYHGRKTCWVQSETRKRLPFSALVAYLNDKARAIENESAHGFRIAILSQALMVECLLGHHRLRRERADRRVAAGRWGSRCSYGPITHGESNSAAFSPAIKTSLRPRMAGN